MYYHLSKFPDQNRISNQSFSTPSNSSSIDSVNRARLCTFIIFKFILCPFSKIREVTPHALVWIRKMHSETLSHPFTCKILSLDFFFLISKKQIFNTSMYGDRTCPERNKLIITRPCTERGLAQILGSKEKKSRERGEAPREDWTKEEACRPERQANILASGSTASPWCCTPGLEQQQQVFSGGGSNKGREAGRRGEEGAYGERVPRQRARPPRSRLSQRESAPTSSGTHLSHRGESPGTAADLLHACSPTVTKRSCRSA